MEMLFVVKWLLPCCRSPGPSKYSQKARFSGSWAGLSLRSFVSFNRFLGAKRTDSLFELVSPSVSSQVPCLWRPSAKARRLLLNPRTTSRWSLGLNAKLSILRWMVSETNSAGAFESKTKREERRHTFKKENRHDQILSKSIQKQEAVAKNARFEQIWRSRKGKKEKLHKMCHFYDVVRVDVEERSNEVQEQEEALEEQRILASYLPLLREFIPSAAEEIESQAYKFKQDDFVYDYYTVKNEMDVADLDADASHPFPLVQVDEDDFYDGPAESEYESDDSNAENNPLNDYPDEISEEEEEEEEDEDEDADEESEGSENELEKNGRNRSSESIDIEDRRLSLDAQLLYEDDIYNYDDYEEDGFDYDDDDSGGNDVEY